MNRFWHWARLFLLFMLPGIAGAFAHETDYGLVREGSFLLSIKPDTYRDGVRVHGLIREDLRIKSNRSRGNCSWGTHVRGGHTLSN